MLEAHVEAGIMVGIPFGTPGLYDFGAHGGMTQRVSELGAVMLKHRLTPVGNCGAGGGQSAAAASGEGLLRRLAPPCTAGARSVPHPLPHDQHRRGLPLPP